jgi:hypothetical protein
MTAIDDSPYNSVAMRFNYILDGFKEIYVGNPAGIPQPLFAN